MATRARRRTLAVAVLATAVVVALECLAVPDHISFPGPDGLSLSGELYRPNGSGPFAAVVAMHGCGGLYERDGALNPRHSDWGERLAAQGFMVLLPDSFGSRGLRSQCREESRAVRAGHERVADAFAAKAYLQGRPDVKAASVSLLGWSNGGSAVLGTIRLGAPGTGPAPDFARAVAFYPGCRVPLERGWRDRIPLTILVGDADDWTGAAPCQALAANARASGARVDIVVYPGAFHDFDHPDLPVRERRGLAYTASGGGHAHIGTDQAARADALRRVPSLLAR